MSQDLVTLISTLSREQQAAVEEFIHYLKETPEQDQGFRAALDAFVREHPELLRRLAQ